MLQLSVRAALRQRQQRPAFNCCMGSSTMQGDSQLGQPEHEQIIGFPYTDIFDLDGQLVHYEKVIELLSPMVTEERLARIEHVARTRTFGITPVVEGLYDMGNLAAVCRSADALGYGAVHCINSSDKYKQSKRTTAGADKWLQVNMWSDTHKCLTSLKKAGYQVVVTHLSRASVNIEDIDWCKPTAVVLGNERAGVSQCAVELADACAVIPMMGFVESFNISVAGALVLYEAQQHRRRRLGHHGDLTPQQQRILTAAWLLKTVRASSSVITQLLSRPPPFWQERSYSRAELEEMRQLHGSSLTGQQGKTLGP